MSEIIAIVAFITGGIILTVTTIMTAFVKKTEDNDNIKTNLTYSGWLVIIGMVIAVLVGIAAAIYGGVSSKVKLVKSGAKFIVDNPELLMG